MSNRLKSNILRSLKLLDANFSGKIDLKVFFSLLELSGGDNSVKIDKSVKNYIYIKVAEKEDKVNYKNALRALEIVKEESCDNSY